MSKDNGYYKQCTLKSGDTCTISWIDEEVAVVGKKLKMQNDNKTWDDRIWTVDSVGSRQEKKIIDAQNEAYRRFFKQSSIGKQLED